MRAGLLFLGHRMMMKTQQIENVIRPADYICDDCGKATTPCAGEDAHRRTTPANRRCRHKGRWESYMVHDKVWAAAGMPARQKRIPNYDESDGSGFLCLDCLEKRLGRDLVPEDFTKLCIDSPSPWDTPKLAAIKAQRSARRVR